MRANGLGARLEMLLDPVEAFRQATGFEPEPWQPDYLRCHGSSVTLKGRQVGASTCTGLLCVRLACLRRRSMSVIVSPSLKQSKEVLERARGQLDRLGEKLVADSADEIELANGSRIVSLPGSRKSVRGWTATGILVIDEAAFMEPATFLAARAIAATGAVTKVQSTPAGPFGHFHTMWKSPDPGWSKFHVSSEDVSTIAGSFLAKERADLTEEEYAQEYLGRFAPAGLGLVDPERLESLVAEGGDVWDRLAAAS